VEALQEFVDNFTYLGIFAVLLLGSLGVPIPEEMPILAAAVLSHDGIVRWWLALPVCLLGVLSGDMVLYWVGRHFLTAHAERVPLVLQRHLTYNKILQREVIPRLFGFMARRASSVPDFFSIPPDRVVELGARIEF
jgi:membrane protein DedA with SNARE-associated domain